MKEYGVLDYVKRMEERLQKREVAFLEIEKDGKSYRVIGTPQQALDYIRSGFKVSLAE